MADAHQGSRDRLATRQQHAGQSPAWHQAAAGASPRPTPAGGTSPRPADPGRVAGTEQLHHQPSTSRPPRPSQAHRRPGRPR